jgi:glycosyltransferase involved in cell wall biosynthesis
MIKFADLTYYAHQEFDQPEQVLERHREAIGFLFYMPPQVHLELVKHLNFEGFTQVQGVKCSFFKKGNRFWSIPFKTHRYLKKQQPDVILVQGLIFPLQVLLLRLTMGKKTRIVVQHHGEMPARGLKSWFQKMADRCTDAYIFTAAGNAAPWIRKHIIGAASKCYEVLEASTYLEKQDRQQARTRLAITGDLNFLWVGRLNANKDPLTVLKAFRAYYTLQGQARLYMIYQEENLLPEIMAFIRRHPGLEKAVLLVGRVPRQEMACWYSAVDYYISASHLEGSGSALLDIPPFRKITGGGKYGYLFQAGDPGSLLHCLQTLPASREPGQGEAICRYFTQALSFRAIAEQLTAVLNALVAK